MRPPSSSLRALFPRVGDLLLQHVELRPARDRADVRRLVHRIARLVRLHLGDECIDERPIDRFVHVDPFDRAARLPRVVERAVGEAGRGRFHIGVVADVHRILAAELQLDLDHPACGDRGDLRAGRVRAGEEHAVDRLAQQRGARRAVADDGNEDVRRDPRFVQHLADVDAGERRVLGGLVENGIAGDQRRHENVAADEVRIVPRGDVRDDAERLVRDALLELAGLGMDFLVAQRARRLGEKEVDPREEAVQFVARLTDRLADFLRQRSRERLAQGDDALAKARDSGNALGDRHARPPLLTRARRLVLALHRGEIVGNDVDQCGAGGGIDDFHERSWRVRARMPRTCAAPPPRGSRPGSACRRRASGRSDRGTRGATARRTRSRGLSSAAPR